MSTLAVVIPVYQAEHTLQALLAELCPVLESISSDWQIWLVDDASRDGSWAEVERAATADPRIRGLRLIRNFGEHVAITAGLDHADADHVVIMACDQQDDPAAIPQMLAAAHAGADLVLVRRLRRKDAWLKRLFARAFYATISLLVSVNYDYRVGNYRLLTRRTLRYFNAHRERTRNVNAIMALMNVTTAYVDVAHRPRSHGRSTYSFGKSSRMAGSVIVGYSDVPLLLGDVVFQSLVVEFDLTKPSRSLSLSLSLSLSPCPRPVPLFFPVPLFCPFFLFSRDLFGVCHMTTHRCDVTARRCGA